MGGKKSDRFNLSISKKHNEEFFLLSKMPDKIKVWSKYCFKNKSVVVLTKHLTPKM